MSEPLGWVGLGAMGAVMAKNLNAHLKKSGAPALYVYNRDSSKCAGLVSDGATQCGTLAELSNPCKIIFLMLGDDDATRAVVSALLHSDSDHTGKILINCSTVSPDITQWSATEASGLGATLIAAPVFGRPDAAAAAKLVVAAAGPLSAMSKVMPYLDVLGRKVLLIGEDPEKAAVFKLSGNFMIVGIIELLGEAMSLCETNGIGRESYLEFIKEMFPAPSMVGYATRIARDELDAGTGFSVQGGLKDVGLMRSVARSSCCPLPAADIAFNHLLTAKALGYGASDWGALSLASRHAATLPLPPAPPQPRK
ncbi:hypothetical protein CEUSTIGMA_g11103.t1 [Chlamydomonas eustigma]|uniref:6-phosphogluconate dehydrogenase NADP-binding domain-containing protein n=1 Tax=Chlamydomonas eustigma TaxID=1157962 RepID=A0A250XKS5_9CHLO|nr:hypothetical protein CEUSTIGMA_g11103.t1 [Chlamydomonas eustigma]|eukprot:GAX83678.1 hypothetical protein CEUSTIGMA_g11103.t1 [Chlamydomonas eustigma]